MSLQETCVFIFLMVVLQPSSRLIKSSRPPTALALTDCGRSDHHEQEAAVNR